MSRTCPNCGGDIAIRNPTGRCDHLYYPENVPKKEKLTEKEITKAYNNMPFKVRDLCSKVLLRYQIRDLEIERARAIKHHKAHLAEIDRHLSNCRNDL